MGVIEVIVDTIPVGACCTASMERDTPKNGPNTEPSEICFIDLISLKASNILFQFFDMVITIEKPIIAAIILISVAAKGS